MCIGEGRVLRELQPVTSAPHGGDEKLMRMAAVLVLVGQR